MKPFHAIIFDMDGVLVDSEPSHELAFIELFRQAGYADTHGIHFPDYYGRSDRALITDFLARHKPPHSLEDLSAWKDRLFIEIIRRDQPIFKEVPSLLANLARLYKLGVASGSYHSIIEIVLALQNLRPNFTAIASAEDVAREKPAPDVFLLAAERLGVKPSDCCVIEDSAAGVEGARSAGMAVIAITNTLPREKLSRAHHIVSSYAEIGELLLGPDTLSPRACRS